MSCRPAISSMSLGRAWVHDMSKKLQQASYHGFQGIEIFFEDLEYIAAASPHGKTDTGLKHAAYHVRDLCRALNLTVIVLQPFSNYDGLRDRTRHAQRIEELKLWMVLADILETDMIQIPASFLSEQDVTDDLKVIVSDLQEVADMGSNRSRPLRFAYESLCFSTHIDTWEQCWDVVQRVNRPNFGVCLDTFNMAGKVYADPASPTGQTPSSFEDTTASIRRLVDTIDVRKIFFVQVVDAERLNSPLVHGHEFHVDGQPPRMSWSRNCRLFYGEQDLGGYLPIREITDAIINGLGYRGWISMELFNRSMNDAAPSVPSEHARRGIASWEKIKRDCGLQTVPSEVEVKMDCSYAAPSFVPAPSQEISIA